jgi:hypothetical protein
MSWIDAGQGTGVGLHRGFAGDGFHATGTQGFACFQGDTQMRSMILGVAVVSALTFGSSSAKAQVGVVIGNPAYDTGVVVGQPYYGVVPRVVYRPAVSVYSGTTYYNSGYSGVVAPGVSVYAAPVVYAPAYYRRGLLGRRYYRAW